MLQGCLMCVWADGRLLGVVGLVAWLMLRLSRSLLVRSCVGWGSWIVGLVSCTIISMCIDLATWRYACKQRTEMVFGGCELVYMLMLCHLLHFCGDAGCPRLVGTVLCVLILVCCGHAPWMCDSFSMHLSLTAQPVFLQLGNRVLCQLLQIWGRVMLATMQPMPTYMVSHAINHKFHVMQVK